MNELTRIEESELAKFAAFTEELGDAESELDVKSFLSKLKGIRAVLEAANKFREQSVKYAQYEAYALIRAFEVCGDTHLIEGGKYRKLAAEWLAGLSDDDRLKYIAMCKNGKTIDNVYKSQVYTPEQRNALASAVHDCKKEARDQLRETGVVVIRDVVMKYESSFPKSMVKDIANGVRHAVLDAGGTGLGDGTFIDPDKRSRDISSAIANKIDAVVNDISCIADLSQRAESKPIFCIRGNGKKLGMLDITYIILAGIGCAELKFDSYEAKKNACSIIYQIVGDVK